MNITADSTLVQRAIGMRARSSAEMLRVAMTTAIEPRAMHARPMLPTRRSIPIPATDHIARIRATGQVLPRHRRLTEHRGLADHGFSTPPALPPPPTSRLTTEG